MRFSRRAAGFAVLSVLLIGLGATTGIALHRLWEFRNSVEQLADELTLDAGPEAVYTGGLRVYTSSITSAIFGVRGDGEPLDRVRPEGHEPLQGALVAIEPGTGFVKALVGGRQRPVAGTRHGEMSLFALRRHTPCSPIAASGDCPPSSGVSLTVMVVSCIERRPTSAQ